MNRNKIIKYIIIALSGSLVFVLLSMYLRNATGSELKGVQVILTAKVLEDDVFQLFYWEESEPKFRIEKSIRTQLKGGNHFQEIAFDLPTLKNLYRLRLDIGENKDQQNVHIKGIRFLSNDGEHDFDEEKFNQLFAPNKYIKALGNGQFSGGSGSSGDRVFYDPYFISVDSSEEMAMIKSNRLTDFPFPIAALVSLVFVLFLLKNKNRISLTYKGAFVVIFMIILIVPTLQNKIGITKKMENLEKRKLAEKPDFSWAKDFVKEFEAYYDDNFGLRNHLVNLGGTYKTKLFRSSKNADLVMFGKDKWLFYNRRVGNSRMFKSYTRTNLLSPDTLKLLVGNWEARKEKYEAEDRKYLLAFWPNKHSIYPEQMSSIMKMQIRDTLSRADQILRQIKKNGSQVKLTDVRPKLVAEKGKQQVYHKFDSHWNDYGAFLAYQDFFRQNRDVLHIEPKSTNDFDIEWADYYGGELIQLLGVQNKGFFKEQRPRFTLKQKENQIQYLPIEGFPKLTIRTRNEHSGNRLRALIFRDSFTNSLEQFFSLHFHEVTYIWSEHKEYYVRKLQPDVIIDGFVEREIGNKIN
ncbi:MAG: alginate O-acetyltransferase AlgX-related protein [Aurantibacter sp.]